MQRAPSTDLTRLGRAIELGLSECVRAVSRSIADIGCGFCDECDLLLEMFPNAALTLVDQDSACIDHLNRWKNGNSRHIRVILGDARQLAAIMPGPYEFVIIRHPDIGTQPTIWAAILSAAVAQLATTGVLMVLTYTTAEAETARMILRTLPIQEMRVNPMSGTPVALAGNDRYILMCERN